MGAGVYLRRNGSALFASLVMLNAACGNRDAAKLGSTSRPPIATATSDEFHYDDPCSLLEPKEVETVLGAPLGTQPYRASHGISSPAADGESCVYEAGDFRAVELTVTFKDGAQAYRISSYGAQLIGAARAPSAQTTKALTRDDSTDLAGEWDEAQLTALNCCIFNALRGDQMITIDFTGSDATLRQAAGLVDAAFKRIDKPLKVDGADGVAAAKSFAKTRPQAMDVCSLLSRAEVEAVVGPLTGDPKSGGHDSCAYPVPSKGGPGSNYELEVRWIAGNYDWRINAHVSQVAGMAMGLAKTKESAEPSRAEAPLGPSDAWSHAGFIDNAFAIVKKDVELKVAVRGVDPAAARNLAIAASRKI